MKDEPLTYMLRAPGCVTGPCESLFSVAAAKSLEMPIGTEIVPLFERPTEADYEGKEMLERIPDVGVILALKRDAARYRWLRGGDCNIMLYGKWYGGEFADAAIDAAMSSPSAPEGKE